MTALYDAIQYFSWDQHAELAFSSKAAPGILNPLLIRLFFFSDHFIFVHTAGNVLTVLFLFLFFLIYFQVRILSRVLCGEPLNPKF